jgi:hypothetical protein
MNGAALIPIAVTDHRKGKKKKSLRRVPSAKA